MEDKELENELYETIRDLRQRIYELEDKNEELKWEKEQLQDRIDYLLQDRRDNYKRISISEQVGVYDKDFI